MAGHEIKPQVILLDIEGTVTPVSFVYEVLFPFARQHGPLFLQQHWDDEDLHDSKRQLSDLNALDRESGAPSMLALPPEHKCTAAIEYYLWLMDRDSKATPLKYIQGLVWRRGFESGELRSEVFPDVIPALSRWRGHGQTIAIYSSGSIEAQQQLFRHTGEGDLTPLIAAYFDTNVGSKREPASYDRIASELSVAAPAMVFVSDMLQELDAAGSAGLKTALCVRPGNATITEVHDHPVIRSFAELF